MTEGQWTPPQDLADKDFLIVKEVAKVLRVSPMTVYRLVEEGELESHRMGRAIRIPLTALTTYINDSRLPPR